MLLSIVTLHSIRVRCHTATVQQHRGRVQVIIICHVRVVWLSDGRSILRRQHLVVVSLQEVLVDDGMSLVSVTIASIAVLHLGNLEDWIIFVEFLMIRAYTSSAVARMDHIVAITLIKTAFSQYNRGLNVWVWWTVLCCCGRGYLELHQDLLQLIIVGLVLIDAYVFLVWWRQEG